MSDPTLRQGSRTPESAPAQPRASTSGGGAGVSPASAGLPPGARVRNGRRLRRVPLLPRQGTQPLRGRHQLRKVWRLALLDVPVGDRQQSRDLLRRGSVLTNPAVPGVQRQGHLRLRSGRASPLAGPRDEVVPSMCLRGELVRRIDHEVHRTADALLCVPDRLSRLGERDVADDHQIDVASNRLRAPQMTERGSAWKYTRPCSSLRVITPASQRTFSSRCTLPTASRVSFTTPRRW